MSTDKALFVFVKTNNMLFKINLSILISALLMLTACNSGKPKKPGTEKGKGPVLIDVSVAELRTYTNTVEANGNVLAGEYVQLRPEMSGRVVYVNLIEGRQVEAGTLLLKLYDEDLKAQLKKTESQLGIARKTEARLKTLLSVNGLNQQEYDLALSQVQTLEADKDYINAQLRRTEVRAPFSGSIGLRRVSNGAYVTPADVLATLQQINMLKVDFVVPESYAAMVANGDLVSLISEGGNKHTAKVLAIEPLVNASTRNIQVRAVVLPGGVLRPGAFVKVSIDVARNKKALLVPSSCIIPETRFKKMALIRQGKAEMVTVETGYRGEDKVEIISGLAPGDTFAINGILYLKPGAEVKIRAVKP